ncbi:unnamed protein product [Lactuca virosa]|uniref:Uncharacterized protein n=1 Tax=Lactuca virosa TaxID=75947 RepID=A0AAU9PID4_9ASTR|nr:unnamed protein product [Lactuca virosa]
MRKYSTLLNIGRSNKRWVQETSYLTSHHIHIRHHPQSPLTPLPLPPPPLPSPPFSFSFSHVSKNRCGLLNTVSHNYSRTTLSNLSHNHLHAKLSTLHTLELSNDMVDYSLDYQVTVKDIEVISAAQAPTHELWLPLTNLDLLLPPLAAGVFFCYKKNDDTATSTETVVKTLKKSLGIVLSTFYPLAGEILPNRLGEPEVLCNNYGVEFVHAHADVDLQTLDLHHPDETVKGKLVPKINRGVISVQVTELKCGAIILSCAFDHRFTDGDSLNMFLAAWVDLTQFNKISNIPSFRSSILNPRRPPHYDTTFDDLYIPISSLPPPTPSCDDELCSRIYYIHAESVNNLQSQASTKDIRRSKVQSFTAYIWKLLAQQVDDDVNKTSRVGVVVSGRHFLTGNSEEESSMLKNHFGNILSIPYGEANNRQLKEMTLNEVANKVHEFVKETTNEEHFRGLVDWVELHRPEPAVARVYFKLQETDGDAIVVSSGQGLPIKDMNFGLGEPIFWILPFPMGGSNWIYNYHAECET